MSAARQARVEQAIEDRDRLYRRYRAAKKVEHEELFGIPVHGPLLRKFNATLGHFGIEDAERLIAYVRDVNYTWLRNAPENIRFAALQMIGYRIVRIRQRAGLVPFDDPLPGEESDAYRLCRQEIGL